MGEYEDKKVLENFNAHCDGIIQTIKANISNVIKAEMEEIINEVYEKREIE